MGIKTGTVLVENRPHCILINGQTELAGEKDYYLGPAFKFLQETGDDQRLSQKGFPRRKKSLAIPGNQGFEFLLQRREIDKGPLLLDRRTGELDRDIFAEVRPRLG